MSRNNPNLVLAVLAVMVVAGVGIGSGQEQQPQLANWLDEQGRSIDGNG
jgi:cell division GTPase FtsZ